MMKEPDQLKMQKQEAKERAANIMESAGYDPIAELVSIAQDASIDRTDKISIHKELAKYVYPQLKAIDHKHVVSGGLNIQIVQFSPPKKEEPKDNGDTTTIQVEAKALPG